MNTNRVKCPLCGSWVPTSRISGAMSETDSRARPTAKGAPDVRERGREAARARSSLFPMFCRWPVAISKGREPK
jgi:hypothetical protein